MERSDNQPVSVLWAYDGSAGASEVSSVLKRLAPNIGAVQVLTVAPHRLVSGARPEPTLLRGVTNSTRNQALSAAQEIARQGAVSLSELPASVEAISIWGNPVQVILRQASKTGADLILLGSKGQSALGFLLLGSVSSAVVQHATRAVMVVRPGHATMRRVLIAYDGSSPARKLLQFIPRLLDPNETQLLLMNVAEPFTVPRGTGLAYYARAVGAAHEINAQHKARAQRSLDAAKAVLAGQGYSTATEVVLGQAAQELLEATKRHAVDLVVVGSRKPSLVRHYLLGSTAEKLVRHAGVSVLVVR